MTEGTVKLPVEVEVTQERFGKTRSINVLLPDSPPTALDTQEWRLEEVSIDSTLRESLQMKNIDETRLVGHVVVELNTLEWEFVE
ncbi:hypothetical protein EXE43_10165 [Halorubrum sp. SS5]|nr:hypothetical protein EXE43_10165 [Halorubrum sp. SS5]